MDKSSFSGDSRTTIQNLRTENELSIPHNISQKDYQSYVDKISQLYNSIIQDLSQPDLGERCVFLAQNIQSDISLPNHLFSHIEVFYDLINSLIPQEEKLHLLDSICFCLARISYVSHEILIAFPTKLLASLLYLLINHIPQNHHLVSLINNVFKDYTLDMENKVYSFFRSKDIFIYYAKVIESSFITIEDIALINNFTSSTDFEFSTLTLFFSQVLCQAFNYPNEINVPLICATFCIFPQSYNEVNCNERLKFLRKNSNFLKIAYSIIQYSAAGRLVFETKDIKYPILMNIYELCPKSLDIPKERLELAAQIPEINEVVLFFLHSIFSLFNDFTCPFFFTDGLDFFLSYESKMDTFNKVIDPIIIPILLNYIQDSPDEVKIQAILCLSQYISVFPDASQIIVNNMFFEANQSYSSYHAFMNMLMELSNSQNFNNKMVYIQFIAFVVGTGKTYACDNQANCDELLMTFESCLNFLFEMSLEINEDETIDEIIFSSINGIKQQMFNLGGPFRAAFQQWLETNKDWEQIEESYETKEIILNIIELIKNPDLS